jgi:hypothetical protein
LIEDNITIALEEMGYESLKCTEWTQDRVQVWVFYDGNKLFCSITAAD